jgi:hypothetical protein
MPAITGANAKMAMKVATTYGTAVSCGASDQLSGVTLDANENATAIMVPVIGSGDQMLNTAERGNFSPSATISGPVAYNSPTNVAVAQMFGGASLTNMGSFFTHSITWNDTANQRFLTLAWQAHSATTASVEFPSAVCRRATYTFPRPNDYMGLEVELLGDQYRITGNTNTYATLNNVTEAAAARVVWQVSDEFLINVQSSGALTTGTDRRELASATLEYSRPQEHEYEAKGTAGNGIPVATGEYPFVVTLTCTFRTLDDFTYFTAHQAGTEYKASLTESLSGSNFKYIHNLPRLKILESPQSGLLEGGNNSLTVVFQGLVAPTIPTGMISRYPYLLISNSRSSSFLS